MLYLSAKQHLRRVINQNFPPEISIRFTFRSDSEIWIPKEDEGVWNRHKKGTESIHILFDGLELFECPQSLDPRLFPVYFLKAFKQAILDGRIRFDRKIEWTDNATAKRNRSQIINKKHRQLEESFKFARNNPDATQMIEKRIRPLGKRTVVSLKEVN